MAELVYFPDEMLILQAAVLRHPELMERLKEVAHHDFEMKLAICCTYVEIMLDGDYDQAQILHLCTLVTDRLNKMERKSAGGIVLPLAGITKH